MIEEYEVIKKHKGPKTPFKIFLSITIILFFLLGMSFIRRETVQTGHVISGVNVEDLLGFVLFMAALILVFLWRKKPKK
jgi:formate/nitrite transporter FocA (FNT family)